MRFFSKTTIALICLCVLCLFVGVSLEEVSGLEFRAQTDFFGDFKEGEFLKDNTSPVDLIEYIYNNILLPVSAILAFVAIIFVGFQYIVSGSNPDKRKYALERVKKVFVGGGIILTAVLLLSIINTDITNLSSNLFKNNSNQGICGALHPEGEGDEYDACIANQKVKDFSTPDVQLQDNSIASEVSFTKTSAFWRNAWSVVADEDNNWNDFGSLSEYVEDCNEHNDKDDRNKCVSNKYTTLLRHAYGVDNTFLVKTEGDDVRPSCAAMCVYKDYWAHDNAHKAGDDRELTREGITETNTTLRCNWGVKGDHQRDNSNLKIKHKGSVSGIKVYQLIKGVSDSDFQGSAHRERNQCVADYIEDTSYFANSDKVKLYYNNDNDDYKGNEVFICRCQTPETSLTPEESQSIENSDGAPRTGSAQTDSTASVSSDCCGENYQKSCYNPTKTCARNNSGAGLTRLRTGSRRTGIRVDWSLPVDITNPGVSVSSPFGSAICGTGQNSDYRDKYCPTAYSFGCHRGIDFESGYNESGCNTEIKAITKGRATKVVTTSRGSWGKYVKIVHDDDNYQSIYAHLNSIHPSVLNNPNDITKGQVIGYMGNSGAYGERIDNAEGGQQIGLPCNENSPNIHLHFEVWDKEEYGVPNKLVDPSLLWGNERGWREEWRTNQVLGRCSLAIY